MNERKDMDKGYMWDLTPIFKDSAEWEAAYSRAEEKIGSLEGYKATLLRSAKDMKTALDAMAEACELTEKVYLYAMFLKDSDGSNPECQSREARGEALFVKLQAAVSYISPALLSIDENELDKMLKDDALSGYRRYI